MVITDTGRRETFITALVAIFGTPEPTRSQLRELGRWAQIETGRAKPFGGGYLYALLHPDKWPKYGINPKLYHAILRRAGMEALNGVHKVEIVTHVRVREGAVVLAKSRRCARRRCGVHFVPRTPKQKYDSDNCAARAAASRRRRRQEKRRRNKSGRRMR
jgi:hypothetical protein